MKEEVLRKVALVPVVSLGIFIVTVVISLSAQNAALGIIGAVSFMIFLLPAFSCTFALPAGILLDIEDTPFWRKIRLYILSLAFVLPLTVMLMVITTDSIFHFLPNYYEAMTLGADLLVVQEMRAEAESLSYIIGGITYGTMILAGLIYRVAKAKKAEA